jgi:transcriptional regulator with XRE-family HTH domain
MERTIGIRDKKPAVYKNGMPELAYRLALLGMTDQNIAMALGITRKTVNVWKKRRPAFMEALTKGKMEADMKVAEALFKKACGYKYREIVKTKNREGEVILTTETIKHHPPDAYACLNWLRLRQGDTWRDPSSTININYQAQMDITLLTEQLKDRSIFTTEELELAARIGIEQIAIGMKSGAEDGTVLESEEAKEEEE